MKIENAICINSEGTIIESFRAENLSSEYLLIDLFCLKGILKKIMEMICCEKYPFLYVCITTFFVFGF